MPLLFSESQLFSRDLLSTLIFSECIRCHSFSIFLVNPDPLISIQGHAPFQAVLPLRLPTHLLLIPVMPPRQGICYSQTGTPVLSSLIKETSAAMTLPSSFPQLRLPHRLHCLRCHHALRVSSSSVNWLQQSSQHISAVCHSQ